MRVKIKVKLVHKKDGTWGVLPSQAQSEECKVQNEKQGTGELQISNVKLQNEGTGEVQSEQCKVKKRKVSVSKEIMYERTRRAGFLWQTGMSTVAIARTMGVKASQAQRYVAKFRAMHSSPEAREKMGRESMWILDLLAVAKEKAEF